MLQNLNASGMDLQRASIYEFVQFSPDPTDHVFTAGQSVPGWWSDCLLTSERVGLHVERCSHSDDPGEKKPTERVLCEFTHHCGFFFLCRLILVVTVLQLNTTC